jgi:hypothetical protein
MRAISSAIARAASRWPPCPWRGSSLCVVLGDGVRAQLIREEEHPGTGGADRVGVGELVGPLGQDQLRGANGERARGGTAAAVVSSSGVPNAVPSVR